MAGSTLASLEHYLSTSYHPDCEYVDGELLERSVGESDHSGLQGAIFAWLYSRRKALSIHVYPEMRIQTAATRYRVPDITVTKAKVKGRILAVPPHICIEILSPQDRFARVEEKIDDYLKFGVPYVWLIDPRGRSAWAYTRKGKSECAGVLTAVEPDINLPLQELLSEMEEELER